MYRLIKRIFDFILSLIGIAIMSPLFLIISIMIKCDTKGPVFFKQRRIGLNGKPLYIYMFRTMVTNAEDLIASFTPEQKKEWEESYKLKDDPRITRVGKILRKTSLDELPQLINIIKGEMSIIGPRPVVEEELSWYGNDVDLVLSVKPGLTGWWAVNGRSEVPYPKRCDLELYYVKNASLALDVRILLGTLKVVFSQRGAL